VRSGASDALAHLLIMRGRNRKEGGGEKSGGSGEVLGEKMSRTDSVSTIGGGGGGGGEPAQTHPKPPFVSGYYKNDAEKRDLDTVSKKVV